MNYNSTRDSHRTASAAEAIAAGISREGGLFVPECFPQLTQERLLQLSKLSYIERA